MSYDFKSLSPIDFEDLVRDLIGAELGIRFEAFAVGPDGGTDGRHTRADGEVVLQAKHYAVAGYATLNRRLKQEKTAVDALHPARYILATSTPLTPKRKQELTSILAPHIKASADIYGPTDLNGLLRRFPDIQRTHFKLWLTSTAVLEQLLRAATKAKTAVTKQEILRKLNIYVPNPSIREAQEILEREHVVIISGAPGVGKTTLAQMLSHLYVGEGYEIISIDTLDSGFEEISDAKKQLFFFDDFLGKVRLDESAIRFRDSQIATFITRVRMSPNARFILTTRQYILERARQISESLDDERIQITRYVLDVGSYTRRVRAKIVYNHLLFSGLPRDYIAELVKQDVVDELVDHDHFNPRLIEWMTDVAYLKGVTARAYPSRFVSVLDHPEKLWDHAFRQHIQSRAQHLLITLFFLSEYFHGILMSELRDGYAHVHRALSEQAGIAVDVKDFDVALKELEGSFVTITDPYVSFINPSVADYLSNYTLDRQLLRAVASAVPSAKWSKAVWRTCREGLEKTVISEADIAEMFRPFAAILATLPKSIRELSLPARVRLLLEWWSHTRDASFATGALTIAELPPNEFSRYWDIIEIAGLTVDLATDEFERLPRRKQLIESLDNISRALLVMGQLEATRIKGFREAYNERNAPLPSKSSEALRQAIRYEMDNVSSFLQEISNVEELETYAHDLKENAKWARIRVREDFDDIFDMRREAINDETDPSSDPERIDVNESEDHPISDDEIRAMFEALVDHLSMEGEL